MQSAGYPQSPAFMTGPPGINEYPQVGRPVTKAIQPALLDAHEAPRPGAAYQNAPMKILKSDQSQALQAELEDIETIAEKRQKQEDYINLCAIKAQALQQQTGSDWMSQSANLTLKDINPSLQDFNMIELKKSKRELNHNAVKFRLTIPKNMTIRYEVVYKNLVRDLRKYFTNAFNEVNMMRGRYYGQSGFTQILSLYVN